MAEHEREFISVIIQAVLLWDVHGVPLKNAGSTGGGYAKVPGYYQSEGTVGAGGAGSQSGHGYAGLGYQSGHGYAGLGSQSGHGYAGLGYQDLSAVAPPPGYGAGSTPDSSKYGSSDRSPITLSGGHGASSSSYSDPAAVPPPPQFLPGELLQVEATNEDGGYESETQETGSPQPGAPQPGGGAFAPLAAYPFNMAFVTGQYLPGTYTDYTRSSAHGGDASQENHYIRYESPSSGAGQQWPGQLQQWDGPQPVLQGQTFPSAAQHQVQMPGLGMQSGSGQQAQGFPTVYYQHPPAGQRVSGGGAQMGAGYGMGWR